MFFFFQAEDGIRDLVRSRGLGDVYKRQVNLRSPSPGPWLDPKRFLLDVMNNDAVALALRIDCLLYTSDAADERSSVDLGGRRIIKKKKEQHHRRTHKDKRKITTHAHSMR